VRGAVEAVLNKLDATRAVKVIPEDARLRRRRRGADRLGGQTVGQIGRVDRKVADKLSLRETPAAELDIAALIAGMRRVPQLRPLPRFPAVRRDLSLVVKERSVTSNWSRSCESWIFRSSRIWNT